MRINWQNFQHISWSINGYFGGQPASLQVESRVIVACISILNHVENSFKKFEHRMDARGWINCWMQVFGGTHNLHWCYGAKEQLRIIEKPVEITWLVSVSEYLLLQKSQMFKSQTCKIFRRSMSAGANSGLDPYSSTANCFPLTIFAWELISNYCHKKWNFTYVWLP